MEEKSYRVSELAGHAGVSVRTVRYYIKEGLLPSPKLRGRYALYDEEHLDRLRLILRLKDAYLPLKEIRTKLKDLEIDELRELLNEEVLLSSQQVIPDLMSLEPEPQDAKGGDPASARDYITRVLKAHTPAPEQSKAAPAPAPQPIPTPQIKKRKAASASQPNWQRIEVISGLELHVRDDVRTQRGGLVARLLAHAQKLFSK